MNPSQKDSILKYKAHKKDLNVSNRYLEIFEYRHGLIDGVFHTQKETGQKFNISSTRVYQIISRVQYELENIK